MLLPCPSSKQLLPFASGRARWRTSRDTHVPNVLPVLSCLWLHHREWKRLYRLLQTTCQFFCRSLSGRGKHVSADLPSRSAVAVSDVCGLADSAFNLVGTLLSNPAAFKGQTLVYTVNEKRQECVHQLAQTLPSLGRSPHDGGRLTDEVSLRLCPKQ